MKLLPEKTESGPWFPCSWDNKDLLCEVSHFGDGRLIKARIKAVKASPGTLTREQAQVIIDLILPQIDTITQDELNRISKVVLGR